MKVTRHFVAASGPTIGPTVHYRRAGEGPPVALFHESPRSSVALLPLMQRLAPRFTVFGFDTPGFGNSAPLALARPEVADYADAFVAVFDRIGLETVPVYGTHTGAAIALELARNHRRRVSVAILDGFPCFSPAEQENILNQYLPPFRPSWDGGHVAQLWARVRDQCSFFPWYLAGRSARLPGDPPSLAHHDSVFLDYLRAGDDYRPAYAAAFRYDGPAAARRTVVPVVYMARRDDILFPHLDRLPPLPAGAAIQRLGADRDQWAAAIAEAIAGHESQQAPPPLDAGAAALDRGAEGGVRSAFLNGAEHSVLVRAAGGGPGRPIVLLHRTPGRAASLDRVMARLATGRPVFALDLFGAGESGALADPQPALRDFADGLRGVLDRLGLEDCDLVGEFTGGALALGLAEVAGDKVRRVVVVEPPPADAGQLAALSERYVPDLALDWDGRQATAAWWWARDSLLYSPWFDRRQVRARTLGTDVDVAGLHDRFVAALLGREGNLALCRAAFERPIDDLARRAGCPVGWIDLADGPVEGRSGGRLSDPAPRPLARTIVRTLEEL